MDINKVTLIGRITQDPELKQTPGGQSVLSTSLVTNKTWKDQSGTQQEKAEFHNLVLWGKTAEIFDQYVIKGQRVYIEGELTTRSWEAQDGSKRYRTEIRVSTLVMLDKPKGAQASNEDDEFPPFEGDNVQNEAKPKYAKPAPKKEDEISIEDIPF